MIRGLRRQRRWDDLIADPYFPMYVGRLMGAAEMCSHWLMLHPDDQAQQMGQRLASIAEG